MTRRRYDYGEIASLRRQGLTYQQIADCIGCGLSTVDAALREAGMVAKRWRTWPHSQIAQAVEAYQRGASGDAVAGMLGCSWPTARSVLVRNGVAIRLPGRHGAAGKGTVPPGWLRVHVEDGDEDWLHEPSGVSCTLTDRLEGPGRFVVIDPDLGAFETLADALGAVEVTT